MEVVEVLKYGIDLRKTLARLSLSRQETGILQYRTFNKTSSNAKMVKLSVWFLGTLESRNPAGMFSGCRHGNVSAAGRRIRAELQTSSSHLLGVI